MSRVALDTTIRRRRPGPLGIALVNVVGSLLLGLLAGACLDPTLFLIAGVGLCGSFTTFSTAILDVVSRWQRRARIAAVALLLLTLGCSLLACAAGYAIGLRL
ncbi:hypothetical protein BSZ39_10865 [Bowdeniella nasicola]|uniref:Fluoride-specific ion channel FluC n=2 Tax=Bowdeniella nasicola TaxID=208480 RepID=A0A1Q5PZX5_9ACTO|nr:hypothetical protein BSZ39_10865 [Bowdeniella nasicola]